MQDEIAGAVAAALRKSLLGEETQTSRVTSDFEAYNAYLLGLSYFNKMTPDDWDKAIEQFELALERDPDMALAWAGLSRTHTMATGFGSEFARGFELARAAAEKAIQLDPDLADAYLALAEVQLSYDWDWDGAEGSLRRAIALRPGDPDIVAELAQLKTVRGDYFSAYENIELARAQDPLNRPLARTEISMLSRMGRLDEALEKAEFMAHATPDSGGVNFALASVHRRLGNLEQALRVAEKETFPFLRWMQEAIIYQEMGDPYTAQQKLQELFDNYGDDVSWQVAGVYAAWGDKDETIAALERGIAVRDPGVIYIKSARTIAELLQDDPRYHALLKRMNLQ